MDRWLLLQLSDAAFPVGGFAHSAGLEAAVQLGEMSRGPRERGGSTHGDGTSNEALAGFIASALWQVGLGALPLVRAVHERPSEVAAVDAICDAFLSNHVANRASRTQGRAFLSTSARIFPSPVIGRLDAAVRARETPGHHAPMFGAALAALGVAAEDAQATFLYTALRGVVSAAVRLGLVGPIQAQRIQLDCGPLLDAVLQGCKARSLDEIAQPAPLLDVFGAAQDRLYSRLFQS